MSTETEGRRDSPKTRRDGSHGSGRGDSSGSKAGDAPASKRDGPSGSGPGAPTHAEREAAEMARIVARRAIRRLDMLEWVIFLGGAVLATLGGGLVAWMLAGTAGWDFRTTWLGASVVLFVVPGVIAILKIKRDERTEAEQAEARRRLTE